MHFQMSNSPTPPPGCHPTTALDFICVLMDCPQCDASYAVVPAGPFAWGLYDPATPFAQIGTAFGLLPVCLVHQQVPLVPRDGLPVIRPSTARASAVGNAARLWLTVKGPTADCTRN